MSYGRGFRPDPEGHRVNPFSLHIASRLGDDQLPLETNNRAKGLVPAVLDQNGFNGCSMCAVSCALYPHIGFVASQDDGYKLARCIGIADAGLPNTTPLQDDGAAPNELERAMRTFGVRVARGPASDGRNSDYEPSTINDRPVLGDLQQDAKHLVIGQYGIVPTLPGELKKALASGILITGAIYADAGGPRSVENWDPVTGPLGATTMPAALNHYICIVDYRTDSDGQTIWIFRNSWGIGWGLQGDGEGTDGWLAGSGYLYIWDCKAVAS